MDKLQDPVELWDNGVVSPFDPPTGDVVGWLDEFFGKTDAKKRVATRWIYQGKIYESTNCPVPVPDLSALVYATDGWKR